MLTSKNGDVCQPSTLDMKLVINYARRLSLYKGPKTVATAIGKQTTDKEGIMSHVVKLSIIDA